MAEKQLSSSGVLFNERRTFNLDNDQLKELYPSAVPFTMFALQGRETTTTTDPDYKMFEYRNRWRYTHVTVNEASPTSWPNSGAPGNSISGIGLDSEEGVSIDSSLEGREVEIWDSTEATFKGYAYIQSISGSDATLVTVGKPDQASEQVSDLADDDKLYIKGGAYGELSTSPDADHGELEVVWNSCYKERVPVNVSIELKETALRNGGKSSEIARLREEKRKEFDVRRERNLIFGYRPGGIGGEAKGAGGGTDSTFLNHISDSNSNTVRKSMGFISVMRRYGESSNTADDQNFFTRSKGSYDYGAFVEDMEKVFQYADGGVRKAFAGPGAMTFWSKFVHDNTQYNIDLSGTEKDRFGNRIRFLDTGHGILELTPLPIVRRTPYKSWMLIPDDDTIGIKTFIQSNYKTNIKTDDGYDGVKDEYYVMEGLGIKLAEKHHAFQLT